MPALDAGYGLGPGGHSAGGSLDGTLLAEQSLRDEGELLEALDASGSPGGGGHGIAAALSRHDQGHAAHRQHDAYSHPRGAHDQPRVHTQLPRVPERKIRFELDYAEFFAQGQSVADVADTHVPVRSVPHDAAPGALHRAAVGGAVTPAGGELGAAVREAARPVVHGPRA